MTTSPTILITVRPAPVTSRGQPFDALHQGQHITTSRTPFYAAARKLIEQGHDPQSILVMRHEGKDMNGAFAPRDCLRPRLGDAAKLTLEEDSRKGFRFRPYRPRPLAATPHLDRPF